MEDLLREMVLDEREVMILKDVVAIEGGEEVFYNCLIVIFIVDCDSIFCYHLLLLCLAAFTATGE
jgi:hypothetical protein